MALLFVGQTHPRGTSSLLAAAVVLLGCNRTPPPTAHEADPPEKAPVAVDPPQAVTAAASSGIPASPEPPQAAVTPPASAPVTSLPPGDRIYSKARFAWIQPAPRSSKGWLGYLGLGSSVRVRGGSLEKARVQGGEGCKAWYAIEPRGYICENSAATTDPKDPVVVRLAESAPRTDSPWPYEYGESLGSPRYRHAPSRHEQEHDEWDLKDHEKQMERERAGESIPELEGVDLAAAVAGRWGGAPDMSGFTEASGLVREERKLIAKGSTVAWTRSFDLGGRTFLITHDQAIVPKDRVKVYPKSEFHGVELGGEVQLPLAFFRKQDRPKYKRGADGAFVPEGSSWARLAWVGLTGEEAKEGDKRYLATKEPGVWTLASEASVVRVAEVPSVVKASTSTRKTWVDVSVLGGTMVAYENDKPVFATLISPGRGGIPEPGKDALETASTPTGTYRVDGKFVTATMVSSTNDLLVHTEVQYVQNFHGPHALHGAYWHDAWGEKKSGGCVNLAPMDARRIFHWSEPAVPEDWYGMRSVPEAGPATVVSVHK